MAIRFMIHSAEELVNELEQRAQKSREKIGTTRTKLESNELKGEVYAFNEAIFYVKEFIKTQKEDAQDVESANTLESVAPSASGNLAFADDVSNSSSSAKVKPI